MIGAHGNGPSPEEAIRLEIASRISEHQFLTWFDKLGFAFSAPGQLRIQVPNNFFHQYLKSRFLPMIREAVERIAHPSPVAVEFDVEGRPVGSKGPQSRDFEWRQRPWNLSAIPTPGVHVRRESSATPPVGDFPRTGRATAGVIQPGGADAVSSDGKLDVRQGVEARASDDDTSSKFLGLGRPATARLSSPAGETHPGVEATPLNPDYTFERFEMGPCNQLALAASKAVAQSPATSYNPLFLYGRVGLGKTHLLQAIAHEFHRRGQRFAYLSCTTFVNDFIAAVSNNGLERFRNRYRDAGALLIDDVHFLAEKSRSQEEFFHTFNSVHNHHRQIVLTSDCLPSEIPELGERLVSRFKLGLVAHLVEPAFDTRVAILNRKAQTLGLTVGSEVASLIAERIRGNVRELEGAVLRLHTLVTFEHKKLSVDEVRHGLSDLLGTESRRLQLADIQKVVVEEFDVRPADLHSKKRNRSIVVPRQICMYLARTHTDLSLGEIGNFFGGRDHSTVLHSVERVREMILADVQVQGLIPTLERRLGI